jgi:hypothetical protein
LGAEEGLGAGFPLLPDDWLDQACFKLAWRQHGGSGLGLSISDVEEMPFKRIVWFLEAVDERREAEAKALRSAST